MFVLFVCFEKFYFFIVCYRKFNLNLFINIVIYFKEDLIWEIQIYVQVNRQFDNITNFFFLSQKLILYVNFINYIG